VAVMEQRLPYFISSGDIEVQEHASSTQIIIQLIKPLLGEKFLLATPEVKSNQELLNDVSEENGNSTTTSLRADSPS
jgi:hypothetical protein